MAQTWSSISYSLSSLAPSHSRAVISESVSVGSQTLESMASKASPLNTHTPIPDGKSEDQKETVMCLIEMVPKPRTPNWPATPWCFQIVLLRPHFLHRTINLL